MVSQFPGYPVRYKQRMIRHLGKKNLKL